MPSHVAKLILAALSSLTLSESAAVPSAAPTVRLPLGTYQGLRNEHYRQDEFLGIPYAQPPVGPLRFASPKPITKPFDKVQTATEYSLMCIGYGSDTQNLGNPVSEDCLTINVVRPAGVKPGDNLPVGVWVHGGVSLTGSSSIALLLLTFC